jgi:hypothetical protein
MAAQGKSINRFHDGNVLDVIATDTHPLGRCTTSMVHKLCLYLSFATLLWSSLYTSELVAMAMLIVTNDRLDEKKCPFYAFDIYISLSLCLRHSILLLSEDTVFA